MSQQRLTESQEKTKQQIARRESQPTSARSFQGGLHPLLHLQRTIGNRAMARLLQAKLAVSHPGDPYEREAERVAEQVTNMPSPASTPTAQRQMMPEEEKDTPPLQTKPLATSMTPLVQRQAMPEEEKKAEPPVQKKPLAESITPLAQRQMIPEEEKKEDKPVQPKSLLQRAAGEESVDADHGIEQRLGQSSGSPLPEAVRSYMEPRFGTDFSGVHVHTGSESQHLNRSLNAQAFTVGQDIYYGASKSPTDLSLTAHELTHVVQQTGGGTTQRKLARGEPDMFLRRAGQALLAPKLTHGVQQDGEQLQRARTQTKEGAATGGAPSGREKGPLDFLSTSAHDAARASAEPSAPEALVARPARGGQPLPNSVRSYFEPRFGRSFAHVRAHTAAESADMADAFGARAYTVGWDIVFGSGAYAPETNAGRQLLAHELTHVLQSSPRGDVVFRIPLEPAGTPFLAEVFPAWSTPLREQPSRDGRRLADLPRGHAVTVEGGRGWIRVSTGFEGKELVGFISHEQLRRRADQTPDPESGRLARLSADYEAAVKTLDWVMAAEVLDAMNDADIQTRLKKLSGTDQAEMRRGAVNSKNLGGGPRLTAAIDAINLDAPRLAKIIDAYEAARQRGDWVQAGISLSSLNDTDIRARLNRLSRSELAAMRRDAPDRLANLINAALAPKSRTITPAENNILARLTRLGIAAKAEGTEGAAFEAALDDFRKTLRFRMNDLSPGTPLPADVDLVMKALMLWSADPGNKWGEGSWDSTDLVMSAHDYVTVPASQYKCNAYVAEVIYQSLGLVYRIHESAQHKGKYFPYQAKEWGDPVITIPNFMQTTTPRMGDVWSNGSHTGIFLGEYSGKKLYISARDDGDGVFGLKAQVQKEHGVQIKFLPDGGVYRRYTP